jgi:hypothetical protein
MEGHRTAHAAQGFLQDFDVRLWLVRIVFGKVAEIVGSGVAEIAAHCAFGPVEEDDGADVFRGFGRQGQSKECAQGEADHRHSPVGGGRLYVKVLRRLCDFGFDLQVIGIDCAAQNFGFGNRFCHFAVVEVRGKGDETGLGQPGADSFDRLVESPPGVDDEYTGACAGGRGGRESRPVVGVALGMSFRRKLSIRF